MTERRRLGLVEAVQLLGGLGFLGQFHRFRTGRLHLVSQLIGAHARFQLGVAGVFLGEALVQILQEIELAALLLFGCPGRWLQMQDGRVSLAELRALIGRFQEARAPVLGAAYRLFVV